MMARYVHSASQMKPESKAATQPTLDTRVWLLAMLLCTQTPPANQNVLELQPQEMASQCSWGAINDVLYQDCQPPWAALLHPTCIGVSEGMLKERHLHLFNVQRQHLQMPPRCFPGASPMPPKCFPDVSSKWHQMPPQCF